MRTRAALAVFFCLLLPIVSLSAEEPAARRAERTGGRASRHFVLAPQHVLSDAERADLAAEGCIVQRALPEGRYIVKISGDSANIAADLRVKSLTALTAEAKMGRSAYRAAAEAKPFSRIRVLFHDDVDFDGARAAVFAVGAALDDPLAVGFGPLQSLTIRIASSDLEALAGDERVFAVHGAPRRRARTLNASSASLSHIDGVQAAPYSLTGNGVVLTSFELGPADRAHAEFGGRLDVRITCGSAAADPNCNSSDNQRHATHTAGTMIAAGISPAAKGMAPSATLHEFLAADDQGTWLTDKLTTIKSLGSVADNNSWGYVTNWCPTDTCTPPNSGTPNTPWAWTDDLAGGYDSDYSPTLDKIARVNGSLMVFSAGNEANGGGPSAPWYNHNHIDQNGDTTQDVYCYSADGSGSDCPTPCSTGSQFCEIVRHPSHNPWGSIGWLASAKNVIAVAALSTSGFRASFSSCGPTQDGRVKPDISALGVAVASTIPGSICSTNPPPAQCYANMQGTSMAAPVITGGSALLVEQWRKTFGGASPSPDVLKALEIAGADDVGNVGPDYETGYGLFNAKSSIDTIIADGGHGTRIKIDSAVNGQRFDYPVAVAANTNLRVVLSWFDPEIVPLGSDPLNVKTLLNDLDVRVIDPGGNTILPYVLNPADPAAAATRGVNTRDSTEEVEIKGAAAGTYHVIVNGKTVVAAPPQQFVLISNADFTAAPPPCTDPTEPNSTPQTAYGPLPTSSVTQARICDAGDIDYFRFTPNASGALSSVTVAATDTPLTVSAGAGSDTFTPAVSANVAVGSSQTITFATTAGTQYLVSVKPNGTLGASGAYTVSVTYAFTWPARRRAARR